MPSDSSAQMRSKLDLKRLIRLRKQDGGVNPNKINSPLAKYSSSGQLSCVVCQAAIKSELAWTAHLASRSHKERVAALRSLKTVADKRPAPQPTGGTPNKRHRVDGAAPDAPAQPKKGILKNAAALRPATSAQAVPVVVPAVVPAALTATPTPATEDDQQMDTDHSASAATGVDTSRVTATTSTSNTSVEDDGGSGQLPEGFFDDPQQDAKARHVEYVDPVEAEWEKFQREMQTAEAESELILDEDQQEATVGRQIEEVDEQIRNLARVLSMEKRKQQLPAADEASSSAARDSGDSSADEDGVDEFLDWRSKGTWK